MKQNSDTSLQGMLEQLSTVQLDEMLSNELHKDQINADAVRVILDVLNQREKENKPEITPKIRAAYETYRSELQKISQSTSQKNRFKTWTIRVASFVAACFLIVMVLPQQVEADTMLGRLVRWTNDIVEFFSPNDNEHRFESYQFKTDNPGLQQVYDAVVEMGITEPVVPMWLPEGNELIELKIKEYPYKNRIYSCFCLNGKDTIFYIDSLQSETAREYHIIDNQIQIYTVNETNFNILRNNNNWVVMWTIDSLECSIYIDCQEDTLYEVLRSIYTMED